MDYAELRRKLISAARAHPPGEAVPYAFEKRVMARILAQPAADHWALWAAVLWRAAAPCVAVMLILSAWALLKPGPPEKPDLSQQVDNTVLAVVDQDVDSPGR